MGNDDHEHDVASNDEIASKALDVERFGVEFKVTDPQVEEEIAEVVKFIPHEDIQEDGDVPFGFDARSPMHNNSWTANCFQLFGSKYSMCGVGVLQVVEKLWTVRIIPQKCNRIVEQIVDVSVPQVEEEISSQQPALLPLVSRSTRRTILVASLENPADHQQCQGPHGLGFWRERSWQDQTTKTIYRFQ